ncbi:hypothetical protein NEH83_19480 [Streptomyces sp. JUS-F4]|nr:hypothetical protein [Streptomyces sp. JUS-F4]WKN16164.1 hypothetical protein NEH83_19480 [Streptomyces sp. JUS-F4]
MNGDIDSGVPSSTAKPAVHGRGAGPLQVHADRCDSGAGRALREVQQQPAAVVQRGVDAAEAQPVAPEAGRQPGRGVRPADDEVAEQGVPAGRVGEVDGRGGRGGPADGLPPLPHVVGGTGQGVPEVERITVGGPGEERPYGGERGLAGRELCGAADLLVEVAAQQPGVAVHGEERHIEVEQGRDLLPVDRVGRLGGGAPVVARQLAEQLGPVLPAAQVHGVGGGLQEPGVDVGRADDLAHGPAGGVPYGRLDGVAVGGEQRAGLAESGDELVRPAARIQRLARHGGHVGAVLDDDLAAVEADVVGARVHDQVRLEVLGRPRPHAADPGDVDVQLGPGVTGREEQGVEHRALDVEVERGGGRRRTGLARRDVGQRHQGLGVDDDRAVRGGDDVLVVQVGGAQHRQERGGPAEASEVAGAVLRRPVEVGVDHELLPDVGGPDERPGVQRAEERAVRVEECAQGGQELLAVVLLRLVHGLRAVVPDHQADGPPAPVGVAEPRGDGDDPAGPAEERVQLRAVRDGGVQHIGHRPRGTGGGEAQQPVQLGEAVEHRLAAGGLGEAGVERLVPGVLGAEGGDEGADAGLHAEAHERAERGLGDTGEVGESCLVVGRVRALEGGGEPGDALRAVPQIRRVERAEDV